MLMTIFIPGIKVNALTGNDGVEYPDVPNDGYNDLILYYNGETKATHLIKFDSSEGIYVTSTYWFSSGADSLLIYPYYVCRDPYLEQKELCQSITNKFTKYKYYKLINNEWKTANNSMGTIAEFKNIRKILYSTVDIYYRKDAAESTYPEDSYFIPGKHKSDSNAVFLDSALSDKTYSKNNRPPAVELNITDARVNDVDNNREFYLVNFDLGDYYDSKYKLYYGYDVNTQTKYSAEFNQETKKATIKHAFDSVPIYYQLIENDNLSSPVLTGVYSVPIGYTNQNKEIIIKEANSYDDNGNKIITATLDFSNIEKFRDIHPDITYIIDDVIVTDTNYNWTITKDNFSSFYAKHIRVFLGQYSVINEGYYHPKWEGGFTKKPEETPTIPNFDDKYTDVVERELLEQVDMNDLDNGPGIVKMVKAFVGAIKDFIISFFKIIINFFNKLNIWIRACIISLFCIFIISRIIKAVRK